MSIYSGPEISDSGLVYHLDAYNYSNFQGGVITKNYVPFTPQYRSWSTSPTTGQDIIWEHIGTEIQKLFTNDGRGFIAIWGSGFSPGSEIQFSRKFSYSAFVRGIGNATLYVHQASSSANNAMQIGGNSATVALNANTWQRLSITNLYTSNTTTAQNILVGLDSGIGKYVEIKNVQFEYQDEPTLYVNGSRLVSPDLSGNANLTTFSPTPQYTANSLGINGSFSGTVSNNIINGLADNSTDFTVSGWVRYDSNNSYTAWFEKQAVLAASGVARFDLGTIRSSNQTYFTGYNSILNTQVDLTVTHTMPIDIWTNLTVSSSVNTGSRSYINGVLVANTTIPMTWNNSTNPVGIGGFHRKLSGTIGSILIYNRQLSDSEVLQNYQSTRARYGI